MIANMRALAVILLSLSIVKPSLGCSVLSHEAVIDALWDVKLKSVLLRQFPNATKEELKQAHGYAYGGAIIQDLGYYPHGSKPFSDLTHYVRTGDFVIALISESKNLNEFAFALGALMMRYPGEKWIHITRRWTMVTWNWILTRLRRTGAPASAAAWASAARASSARDRAVVTGAMVHLAVTEQFAARRVRCRSG